MARGKVESWWRKIAARENPSPAVAAAQGVLIAASLPFEAVARLRNAFYDIGLSPVLKLPVPVVSIGNLTVGGTGKTPAVVWCAKYLQGRGLKPGVASRGYNPDSPDKAASNDEAALLAEAIPDVPHVWDADRAKAGAALVKQHNCNAVILDDGFQHRRLQRNLNLLLVDALLPFGYGRMLPGGLLREPLSTMRRATHIIITRSNLASRDELVRVRQRIWEFDEGAKLAEAVHAPKGLFFAGGQRQEPEALHGKKAYLFCGIANPQSFLIMATNLGAKIVGMKSFADHHIYAEADLDGVFAEAKERGAEIVLTTQKDRVKCGWREGSSVPLAELRIEFELVRGREAIESALDFLASTAAGVKAE